MPRIVTSLWNGVNYGKMWPVHAKQMIELSCSICFLMPLLYKVLIPLACHIATYYIFGLYLQILINMFEYVVKAFSFTLLSVDVCIDSLAKVGPLRHAMCVPCIDEDEQLGTERFLPLFDICCTSLTNNTFLSLST